VRTTDLLQLGSLFGGEFAQVAFLTTRHGGFLRHQLTKSTHEMAMGKPNAPLDEAGSRVESEENIPLAALRYLLHCEEFDYVSYQDRATHQPPYPGMG
jgi:hypothetical protein